MNLILEDSEKISSDFEVTFSPDGTRFGLIDDYENRMRIWGFEPVDTTSVSNYKMHD